MSERLAPDGSSKTANPDAERTTASFTLERKTLAIEASRMLRESILAGEYEPGQRLREDELARKMNVSRQVIREVLLNLEARGLVKSDPFRGRCVIGVDRSHLVELAPIRALLEGYAVELAILKLTEGDGKELSECASRINDPNLTFGRLKELDRAFHEKIWVLADNGCLLELLHQVAAPFFLRSAYIVMGVSSSPDEIVKDELMCEIREDPTGHIALTEAILERRTQRAVQIIQKHIREYWGDKPGSHWGRWCLASPAAPEASKR